MKDEHKNIQNLLIPFKPPLIFVIVDNPSGWHQNQYVDCSHKHDVQPSSIACSPLMLLRNCIAHSFYLTKIGIIQIQKCPYHPLVLCSRFLQEDQIGWSEEDKRVFPNLKAQVCLGCVYSSMETLKTGKFLTCWGKKQINTCMFIIALYKLCSGAIYFRLKVLYPSY